MFTSSFRLLMAGLVLACALAVLASGLLPESSSFSGAHINLGLDLKGGTQLTLGVETDKAIQGALVHAGQNLRRQANEAGIPVLGPRLMPGGAVELLLPDGASLEKLRATAATAERNVHLGEARTSTDGAKRLALTFTPEYAKQTRDLAVDQVLRTITSRIDQFGVAEPDIRKQAGDRILVQLPGLTNVKRAVQLVGQTAQLSFHVVRDNVANNGLVPVGVSVLPMKQERRGLGDETSHTLAIDTVPVMHGNEIADARPTFGEHGKPAVSLSFTGSGAETFERVTGEHKGQRLAIVLDDTVQSAPVIQEKIAGGMASISGDFTPEEAQDLAISLRSGSLAAPVHVLEERTVGPSLGEASIDSGLLAALIGTVAVMVIMPLRYGWSGMMANGMLFCTLGLLMAGMATFGATLTLPGIAGVVLTIGMAVDANVLIFERIREELALGLSPAKAITAGFERASLSITDSNLTTVLVAIILYICGTGSVRGFAVTLILGILASMFTAITLCRLVLEQWTQRHPGQALSIHGPCKASTLAQRVGHMPFLYYAKQVCLSALVLVLVATSVAWMQGGMHYGVDFAGGVSMQARFAQPLNDGSLKEALTPLKVEGLMLQQYGESGAEWQIRFSLPDTPPQELRANVEQALNDAFPTNQVTLDRLEMVGPKVGDDLRTSALEAIYYAFLLITVYISGRFEQRWGTAALLAGALTVAMLSLQWMGIALEWRIGAALGLTLFLCAKLRLAFASGAMASLIFDVGVTVGTLVLLGQEIDLNVIAALLTIIGYSLNDTIVIFDRIREVLRHEPADSSRSMKAIIEDSIAVTMSRTLLTSGTTLVAALSLFLLGGTVIHGFALTMLIGVTAGTLSSLFVAAPILPLFDSSTGFKDVVRIKTFETPGEHGLV